MDLDVERLLLRIRAEPEAVDLRSELAVRLAVTHPEHARLIEAELDGNAGRDQRWFELMGSLPPAVSKLIYDRPTSRGLVEISTWWIDAELLVEHADLLLQLAPQCHHLGICDGSERVAAVAALPALRWYDEVSFSDTYIEDITPIARSPHLAGLVHLGLSATNLDDAALHELARSTAFPGLRSLDLSDGREEQDYTIAGLRALIEAAYGPSLRRLTVHRVRLGPELAAVVAQLPALVELEASSSSLGDEGVERLAALPRAFERLDLGSCDLGERGLDALRSSRALEALQSLAIGGNVLDDHSCARLLAAPGLGPLRELVLDGSQLGRCGVATCRALAASPLIGTLEHVSASTSTIGPEGAALLAAAPWSRLRSLRLSGCQLGDDGAIALVRSPLMRRLRHLDLQQNDLGDSTAHALLAAETAPDLYVRLGGARFSPELAAALVARFGPRVELTYPWAR